MPATARLLTERLWPGPLTLVLRRGPRGPLEATGGLKTAAVRVPDNPVALVLLSAFGRRYRRFVRQVLRLGQPHDS
ncbi:Sua5/YciO/YrdC/YwlC family protein [Streptomyces sp. SCSIO 30461]|uniref:L-threonylcarbamoyladenylate synthase n=1 Tax=Streptomyces sp. SCSIO 30461 TaxID=3118085 RepID=UPI0030CFE13D